MSPEASPGELSTVFAHLRGMFLTEQDATAAVLQPARDRLGADAARTALLERARARGLRVAGVAARIPEAEQGPRR